MTRVMYLVALENIFGNAIFDNQVKKLLVRIKQARGSEVQLTLLCFLPWIELTRRGVYSNFRRYGQEMAALRAEMDSAGIKLVIVRTLMPSAFFNMTPLGLAWLTVAALPPLCCQILRCRAEVVHCRYYYAAFLALAASRLLPRKVKVIFDVRTLLPEQGIVNGRWCRGGLVFRCWKALERWMFRSAGRVFSVSPAMTARILEENPGLEVETVPNFVDRGVFHPDRGARERIRRVLGLADRRVLVFCGTLGARYPDGRIVEAADNFLRAFGGEGFLLVVTSSDRKRLAGLVRTLESSGWQENVHWRILRSAPGEVPEVLSAADWGLLALADFLTSETFLPLKFSEYLAAGLPILIHPANRELVRLALSYGVGAALDKDSGYDELRKRLLEGEQRMRARCLEVAEAEFDIDVFVPRYSRVYQELGGRKG